LPSVILNELRRDPQLDVDRVVKALGHTAPRQANEVYQPVAIPKAEANARKSLAICCNRATPHAACSCMLTSAGGLIMFDVYLNDRRYLLVVRRGLPIPLRSAPGKWRKSKKMVATVSEEIKLAVQTQGYYMRKLKALKKS
jgi:hypothetical protein